MIIWSMILGLVWLAMTGAYSVLNFAVGTILGWSVLRLSFPKGMQSEWKQLIYMKKIPGFALFFLKELVIANCLMALDLLQSSKRLKPGVIAMHLDVKTDAQIDLLATLITLTPGTLSLDVSADRSKLFIHTMFLNEDRLDEYRQSLKDGFEKRVMELYR